MKDVGRALPSAGTSGAKVADTLKKTIFALSTNSSFVENANGQKGSLFLPPLSQFETMNEERTIYDELTTPRDELSKVTESIKGILSGKSVSSDRRLRSIAPGGASRSVERQKLAYVRRKETVLKREKEGIDKKVLRAASAVTDTAWEIKRELQVEGNEAGYRSEAAMKRLKATIQSNALLEGGRSWMNKRLTASQKATLQLESSTTHSDKDKKKNDEKAKDETTIFLQDAVVLDSKIFEEDQMINTPEVEDIIGEVSQDDLNAERKRLVSILVECLEKPEENWLRPDFLERNESRKPYFLSRDNEPTDNALNDEEVWEKVIVEMVSAKTELETALASMGDISRDEVISELFKMKSAVDNIIRYVSDCAGNDSAEFLRKKFLGETSLSHVKTTNSDTSPGAYVNEMYVIDEFQISTEEFIFEATSAPKGLQENIYEAGNDFDEIYESVLVADVISSEGETPNRSTSISKVNQATSISDVDYEMNFSEESFYKTGNKKYQDDTSDIEVTAADVEVVIGNDGDFIIEENNGIGSAAVVDEKTSSSKKKNNIFLTLTFRTLDVLLFVTEKAITVSEIMN